MKALLQIQSELKAPKTQINAFGKYKYRSCEDIVESLKPLLKEYNCLLTLSDEIINLHDRFYIKATATITDIETKETISVTWFAREEENKKGMDWSQITGASSSYARKYALNGLFAIDDTKDSDSTNTHWKEETPKEVKIFDLSKLEWLKKFAEWKEKWEIMQQVLKIKKDYSISDDVKVELDLFLNTLS